MGQVIELTGFKLHKTVETVQLRDPRHVHRHKFCTRCRADDFAIMDNGDIYCAQCFVRITNMTAKEPSDGPRAA